MNALWYYAIGFILIWVLALLFRKQLKIDIEGPLLMRKTKRLRGFIDSVANRSPRFWRWTMNLGIPVAVFFMAFMVYGIIASVKVMFSTPTVAIVLPGVDIPGSPLYIPFGYGIAAMAILMVVHEFGHGIVARVEGVKIKSIGVLLLAVLPGAFVELDEDDVEKSRGISKLRIYAAGSIFNLGTAAIAMALVFVISSFFVPYAFHDNGVKISGVTPSSPAAGVLKEGMVIHSVNGYTVNNKADYTTVLINKSKPGDKLNYVTDQGTFTVTSAGQPTNASITYPGTRTDTNLAVKDNIAKTYGEIIPWTIYDLNTLFWWIFLLNFLVGAFNLLPMKPLDGGLIFEELLRSRVTEERVNSASRFKGLLKKLSRFSIPENHVNAVVSLVSWGFITILVILIVYGTVPGIMKMIP